MILFASAVLTASLAATGCSYTKGAGKVNTLPTVNHAIATTQETTGAADEKVEEVMTEELLLASQEKQAEGVFCLFVTQDGHLFLF